MRQSDYLLKFQTLDSFRLDAKCGNYLQLLLQDMPEPSLREFFQFLAASIKIECETYTGSDSLRPKGAEQMLSDVRNFARSNHARDTWVPYHTVLGPHELVVVQTIHSRKDWSEKQRFQALFIFRAHCRKEVFMEVQLPIMLEDTFWLDPREAFMPDGVMEKAMFFHNKTGGL